MGPKWQMKIHWILISLKMVNFPIHSEMINFPGSILEYDSSFPCSLNSLISLSDDCLGTLCTWAKWVSGGGTGWGWSILKLKGNCVSFRHGQATWSHASDFYLLCQLLFIYHIYIHINFNSFIYFSYTFLIFYCKNTFNLKFFL